MGISPIYKLYTKVTEATKRDESLQETPYFLYISEPQWHPKKN